MKIVRLILVVLVCVVGVTGFALTPKEEPSLSEKNHQYVVRRTKDAITLDGKLSEASWLKASSTGAFRLANDSAFPKNRTEAKFLWDSTYLYIGFECEDSNIIGRMTKRDANLWEEEAVEVFLSPDDPVLHGYTEIEISPANTLLDLFVRYAKETNGVPAPVALPYHTLNLDIRSAVSLRGTINNENDKDTSWTVEIAIPFRDIMPVGRALPLDGEQWSVNLYRMERFPEREFIGWSPTGLNKFHVPRRFGVIVFSTIEI